MAQSTPKSGNTRFYICEAITVILMFTGFFVHGDPFPDYGWQVLFIFIGMLFGWSTVGLITPSLLGILALAFTPGFDINTAWSSGFGGNLIAIILLFSILAKWLERIGLVGVMMSWFMRRKVFQGKPWVFVSSFLVIIYAMGFLVGAFPAILIGWTFLYAICETVGYEKKSSFMAFFVVNIVAVGAMGDYCKPWSAWGLPAINAYATTVPGSEIGFVPFFVWCVAVHIVSIAILVLVARFVVRLDVSKLQSFDYSKLAWDIKFTNEMKYAVGITIAMIIAFFLPTYLPDGAIKTFLNTLGTSGIIIVALILAASVRNEKGVEFLTFKRVINDDAIPWDAIFLLSATVPLGNAMKSADTGIMSLFTQFAHSNMSGLSEIAFLVVVALFLWLLTQIAHNLVCLVAITPIFMTVAMSLGYNPAVLLMVCQMVLTAALGTPAASTRAGMLFGNGDVIKVGDCYKYGWISNATVFLATLIMGVPLGFLMF